MIWYGVLSAVVVMGLMAALNLKDGGSSASMGEMAKSMTVGQQIDLINAAITRCRNVYPVGSPSALASYPAQPSGSPPRLINATCPGAPSSANAIFSSTSGGFMPLPPDGFDSWEYYNDSAGARIVIRSNATIPSRTRQAICGHFNTKIAIGQGQADVTSTPMTITYWFRRTTVPVENRCI